MMQKVRNIVEDAVCGNMKLGFNISVYFTLIKSQNSKQSTYFSHNILTTMFRLVFRPSSG